MTIDMTGLERLGSVGLDKVFTEIPKGQAKEGIQFAFKIKKAAWIEGKYGYRYHLDVVIRTLDMQTVLASKLWKVYPSMLGPEIIDAIDTDNYDDTWWLVYTEENPNSKANPPRTRLHLIDTQQGTKQYPFTASQDSIVTAPGGPVASVNGVHTEGIDGSNAHTGPSKPAAGDLSSLTADPVCNGSERGQPGPGEEDPPSTSPGTPCLHENIKLSKEHLVDDEPVPGGFYCKDCGKRVG
jgi:hypothetical protein